MADESAQVVDPSAAVLPFSDDFERNREEMEAIPADHLLQLNVVIPSAVTTALGAWPEMRSLRPRLIEELPKFNVARFDKLETYARGAYHANSLYLMASTPAEPVPELAAQCAEMTATFRIDAEALVRRGLLEGSLLRNLSGSTGYRDTALDLYTLAQVFRENWPKIEGKTALELPELLKAEMLVNRLTTALGMREQTPSVVSEAAETRQRAFTLFMRAYSEARRAIAYLEPELVDAIAPSLHVPRGPSKKKPEAGVTAPESPTPVASPSNGQPPLATPSTKVASDSPYTA